jgi:hypothetical protein
VLLGQRLRDLQRQCNNARTSLFMRLLPGLLERFAVHLRRIPRMHLMSVLTKMATG